MLGSLLSLVCFGMCSIHDKIEFTHCVDKADSPNPKRVAVSSNASRDEPSPIQANVWEPGNRMSANPLLKQLVSNPSGQGTRGTIARHSAGAPPRTSEAEGGLVVVAPRTNHKPQTMAVNFMETNRALHNVSSNILP